MVVWCIDRLRRSLIDVLNTVNLMRDATISVRFIADGIDPATSTGRLMLKILATLAEPNANLLSTRSMQEATPRASPMFASIGR